MSRGRQILRQWSLLRCLEGARRGLTTDELLELVEDDCSKRTLYRDLEQLGEAGFPLIDEDGRWRMLRDNEGAWVVPVQPTEVLSVMLSEELLEPAHGTYLSDPLRMLRKRLLAMMSPNGRAWCQELKGTAVATLFAPGDYAEHRAEMHAIETAIHKEHRLRIVYEPPGREAKDRVCDPYCTWFHAGRVYLIAFCHRADDIRTFAVQRIRAAEVLDDSFEPDPGFDPARFVRQGFGVFHGPAYAIAVDFAQSVAHLVREFDYHHTQRVMVREDGWVRLTMQCAGLPEIASWVAGFGGNARPVRPPELIEAVRGLHEKGLERLEAK